MEKEGLSDFFGQLQLFNETLFSQHPTMVGSNTEKGTNLEERPTNPFLRILR